MKLQGIRKVYHNKSGIVEALKGIDLDISTVGITVLLGSSGCGKTSLLNILAGIDKDYEGIIEGMPDFYYLTQEFELMEAMSVLDNLLIVENDLEKCTQLIKEYGLTDQINKKVSTLSNGQKKRVQFMKAILMNPSLLLCDEITAALDHENAELMMEKLKEYSKENQVLLVTHDIALADKYADRIIRINRGIIENDEILHAMSKFNSKKEKNKKNRQETVRLSVKRIRSRKIYSVLHTLILLLCICSIFITSNLFKTIREQNNIYNTFKEGKNLLLSSPNRRKSEDLMFYESNYWEPYVYPIFDVYNYPDVKAVIEENQEIMAVEAFYDEKYELYRYNGIINVYFSNLIQILKYGEEGKKYIAKDVLFERIEEAQIERNKFVYITLIERLWSCLNEITVSYTSFNGTFVEKEAIEPLDVPFVIEYEMDYYIGSIFQDQEIDENSPGGLIGHQRRLENRVHVYTLVNNGKESIPVLYGRMPENENEILLDKNTAELWAKTKHYESIEEMVGQEFVLTVANMADGLYPIGHQFTFTISGIAATENNNYRMAFIDAEFGKDPILSFYFHDLDNLFFEYVNFIVEPNSDAEEVQEKINDYFFFHENSRFVRPLSQILDSKGEQYKDPKSYMTVCMIAVGAMVFLMILETLFESKRIRKEKRVIQSCGYSSGKELLYRNVFYLVIISAVLIVGMPFIINWVNEVGKTMQYAQFMEYDPVLVIGISFIVILFSLLLEKIATKRNY